MYLCTLSVSVLVSAIACFKCICFYALFVFLSEWLHVCSCVCVHAFTSGSCRLSLSSEDTSLPACRRLMGYPPMPGVWSLGWFSQRELGSFQPTLMERRQRMCVFVWVCLCICIGPKHAACVRGEYLFTHTLRTVLFLSVWQLNTYCVFSGGGGDDWVWEVRVRETGERSVFLR